MARHYNQTITDNLKEQFGFKQNEIVENEVIPVLNAVVNIQPILDVVKTKSTDGTIYTTPENKDFYLTGIYLSCAGDTVTMGTAEISFNTFDGIAHVYAIMTNDPGGEVTQSLNFSNRGILLLKNYPIAFTGNGNKYVMITGYTQEVKK